MPFNVFNVIQLWSQRVIDVNNDDLPVRLFLVEECHYTEDLDLFDLAGGSNQLANLADIKWVVVALGLSFGVDNIGVLPSLEMILSMWIRAIITRSAILEGMPHSSRGSLCGGSNCAQSGAFLSSHPV